jgi:long-chain acyl-CoA synthetase
MRPPVRVPGVRAAGRWFSSDEIEATATAWHAEAAAIGDGQRLVAAALPTTADGVALFAALTALPLPVLLLQADAGAWPGRAWPRGTRLVLPPSLAHLAPSARALGGLPSVLADKPLAGGSRCRAPLRLLDSPGITFFTSGSTGAPKPVYRSLQRLLAGVRARLDALALRPGEGIITGVSLAHGHGITRILSAMALGGPLALLDPLDYRAALGTLALPGFGCWSATAHFADVLGRCALAGPAVAPRICLLSSPISRTVFDRFQARFGVPLRQNYSSSETGAIAVDAAAADEIRPGTVGRPLAGVELRCGARPDVPAPSGEAGRIWVRSPWLMDGYGFPAAVEPRDDVDGWWPTRDLGMLDEAGRLVLAGRIDDCVRTREGRLVNLAFVADSLRMARGVRDVAVVPIHGDAGASFGAVLECEPSVTVAALKAGVSDALPSWAWPRALAIVASLPRLPNGRADRRSCSALLRGRA